MSKREFSSEESKGPVKRTEGSPAERTRRATETPGMSRETRNRPSASTAVSPRTAGSVPAVWSSRVSSSDREAVHCIFALAAGFPEESRTRPVTDPARASDAQRRNSAATGAAILEFASVFIVLSPTRCSLQITVRAFKRLRSPDARFQSGRQDGARHRGRRPGRPGDRPDARPFRRRRRRPLSLLEARGGGRRGGDPVARAPIARARVRVPFPPREAGAGGRGGGDPVARAPIVRPPGGSGVSGRLPASRAG